MRILVTGGAGFIGSRLALALKRDIPEATVIALDNLKRRGSELALTRLANGGVQFCHGDIRNREDLNDVGAVDVLVECSAEPSVQAGLSGGQAYLINTNLVGTINCLDHALNHDAVVVYLSTSRVYPIAQLRDLPLVPNGTRLCLRPSAQGPGWSEDGISENFPLDGSRSLYGASKLCSELIITEYVTNYGLRATVNRCGVVTGPWQMGKVDQGFVVLWAARHLYGGSLSYNGFGGTGWQVRDILHVDDLYRLIRMQIERIDDHCGKVYNVGGGKHNSISLAELSEECAKRAGRRINIAADPQTNRVDIPFYVSDNEAIAANTNWRPQATVSDILDDVFDWLQKHRSTLEPLLSG